MTFKRKLLPVLIAGLTLSGGAFADGRIEGRIGDKGENLFLEGAEVRITELNRKTVTTKNGSFSFSSVPAGDYTLEVEYLGANATTRRISVQDNQVTAELIRLDGDALEEIVVYGQAAGAASTLNKERNSDNLITVVSADAIGQLPDQNVAEALQRLPGVYLQRDQGEGRFIGIRGIDPNLNNTKINGINVPAPESGRRSVALDVIPSDLLEGLEVAKTFTPDMDANGIGGQINVKSLSAFDKDGMFLKASADTSYNSLEEENSPKIDLTASNVFSVGEGTDNLGLALSLSYQDRDFGSENVETDGGWDTLETEAGTEFFGAEEIEQRDYIINRERIGVSFNIDLRASENTDLYLRTLYSDFSDQEIRNRNEFKFDDGNAVAGSNTSATWEDAVLEKSLKDRLETQTITSFALGGSSHINDWLVDYELGYSKSEEEEPNRFDTTFVIEDVDLGYNGIGSRPGLFADAAVLDPTNYELDEIVREDNFTEDDELSFAMDFTRDLSTLGYNGTVQFGFKIRRREKSNDIEVQVYDGFPGSPSLAGFTDSVDYDLYNLGPAISEDAVEAFFFGNLSALEIDDDDTLVDSLAGDYEVEEDVDAAYLMSKYNGNNWQLVYGFRYEQTEFRTVGQRILVDDVNGSGDPTPVALTFSDDYSHFLPSLNFRYDFSDDIVIRAAYSQTISRPNFGELSPGGEIEFEEDDGEFEFAAEIGNPDLKAVEADNFDLSIAYYPGGIGVLSASLFHKQLDNPIVVVDTASQTDLSQFVGNVQIDDAEVIQPINGEDADLTGIELSWTYVPQNLPEPFNGMVVGLNATFIDAEAEIPGRTIDLPGMADTVWNASVGYENELVSLRLAATYKSEALLEVLDFSDPRFDRYQDEHLDMSFSAKYRFNDQFQAYLNVINLTDEPFYAYFDRSRFNSQYEEYGRTYTLGIRYTMQ